MLAQHQQQTQQGSRVTPYPVVLDDGTPCALCDITDIIGIIRD
jgi:hypothetical protein